MAFGDRAFLGNVEQEDIGANPVNLPCLEPTAGRIVTVSVFMTFAEWSDHPVVDGSAIGVTSFTYQGSDFVSNRYGYHWTGVVDGTPAAGNITVTPFGSDEFGTAMMLAVEVEADEVVQTAENTQFTAEAPNNVAAVFDESTGANNVVLAAFGAIGGAYNATPSGSGWTEVADEGISGVGALEAHIRVGGGALASASADWNNASTSIAATTLAIEFGESGSASVGRGRLVGGKLVGGVLVG